jgi:hypothetical protein
VNAARDDRLLLMRQTLLVFPAILMLAAATRLGATTLWDESGYNSSLPLTNQIFGSTFSNDTSYLVDDITVGQTWTIDSITGYFQAPGVLPLTGTALLNIFSESGTLPTAGNDPTTGIAVGITYTLISGTNYAVTTSGLNPSWDPATIGSG